MPYDLGDQVPLTFLTVDSSGNPVNCNTVVLTVTKPDNTTDSPAVTNPPAVTGTYTVTYSPATAGRYVVRWVATVTNPQAYTDAFDVRESVPPLLFSLSDAKATLNITSTTHDQKIRDLLESTTAAVEFLAGAVVRRSVSERYDTSGFMSSLGLRTVPLISVQSVTSILLGGYTYNVNDLDVDTDTGIIQFKNGRAIVGPVRIAYTAGRTIVPAAIRDAGRIILKHLWTVQTGPSGLPRLNDPNDQGQTMMVGLGYALPNRAIQLLQPYMRAGKFA